MERHFQRDEDTSEHLSLLSGAQARRVREEELARVSTIFKRIPLETQKPSATEWRLFSDQLAKKVDKESRKLGLMRFAQSLKDTYTATDSTALRLMIVVMAVIVLLILGGLVWVAAVLAMETFAPATAQAVPVKPDVVVVWTQPASEHTLV